MCQLGRSGTKVHKIPKEKALTAYKVVVKQYGIRGLLPLVFNNVQFERLEDEKFHSFVKTYHLGGSFLTESPAPPSDRYRGNDIGNGRGFWAWKMKESAGVRANLSWRHVYEVRMWGRVVKHRLGYRAEYIKFVKKVKK